MRLDTPNATCRIGIDVGGTFTDLVLVDRATGALTVFKEPSTPSDPSQPGAETYSAVPSKTVPPMVMI